jgi:hypothetical protein
MMSVSQTALNLARTNDFQTLIEAIAVYGAIYAKDMMSDMLQEPEYIKAEGMPTRDIMIDRALDFALGTCPLMAIDNGYGDEHPGVVQDMSQPEIVHMIKLAMRDVLEPGSDLLKLEYRVPNAKPVDQPA